MYADPRFWEDEKDSPLLARNHGFVTPENVALRMARAQVWPMLLGAQPCDVSAADKVTSESILRILLRDSERTFIPKDDPVVQARTLARQQTHQRNLKIAIAEINDYHQGLGYISAFCTLFLSSQEVGSILLALHRSEKHSRGYFAAEPEAFVGDARVFARLMQKYYPEVHANITKWGCVPEMYAVKWFVGLGVHFLPFQYLFDFYELYFRFGSEMIFKFALAYVGEFRKELAEAANTSALMTILRAEDSHSEWNLPAEISIVQFEGILSKALSMDLSKDNWEAMRAEEREKVRVDCLKATQRLAELAGDDSDGIAFSDEED
jgi:hypothetical protein